MTFWAALIVFAIRGNWVGFAIGLGVELFILLLITVAAIETLTAGLWRLFTTVGMVISTFGPTTLCQHHIGLSLSDE
ncbi:MAG: hypothetical protein IPI00_06405 [Flavobacteriales bacterium]|nr:hypothetical protein [Flavobacteriales bacterium]